MNTPKKKILKYQIPEIESPVEVIPWDSVKTFTSKSTGRKMVRHVIEVLGPEHLGLDVHDLGHVARHDLGKRLVVDYDVESHTLFPYIE